MITLAPGVSPVAIAAGQNNNTFAIGSNGALYAWGFNSFGDLGDGSTTERYSPEVITLAPGVSPVAIAAGQATTPSQSAPTVPSTPGEPTTGAPSAMAPQSNTTAPK